MLPKPLTAHSCYKVLRRWLESRAGMFAAPSAAQHSGGDGGDHGRGSEDFGGGIGDGGGSSGVGGGMGGSMGSGVFSCDGDGHGTSSSSPRMACTCGGGGGSSSSTSGGVGGGHAAGGGSGARNMSDAEMRDVGQPSWPTHG